MGRKRIPITERDKDQIQTLSGFGLTLDQIATVLNISPRTLDNWLQDEEIDAFYRKGCALAQVEIAQTLFEKAKSGDMTALIWWEKTRAGRTDKIDIKQKGEVTLLAEAELSKTLDAIEGKLPPAVFATVIEAIASIDAERA